MHTVLMPENGRVVIPSSLRAELDLQAGQRLYLESRDGGIFMSTANQRRQQRQRYFSQWLTAPASRIASEELMAERRQEAKQDEEAPARYKSSQIKA